MNKKGLITFLRDNGKTKEYSWEELAEQFGIKSGEAARSIWRKYRSSNNEQTASVFNELKNDPNVKTLWYGKDAQGREKFSAYLTKQKDELNQEDIQEAFKSSIKNYKAPKVKKVSKKYEKTCAIINLFDAHINKLALIEETNVESTSVEKNVIVFEKAFNILLNQVMLYNPETIIIPVGSDFFHTNDSRLATKKGTPQEVITKPERAFELGIDTYRACIDRARQVCKNVIVPVIPGNHDCYSDDTEVLTQRGFISHNDLKEDDLIATINNKTFETEYQNYSDYFVKSFKGDVIQYTHRNLNSIVTPGHRMFTRLDNEDSYSYKKAIEIVGTQGHRFRLKAENFQDDNIELGFGGGLNKRDDWLKLFAWINSDGSKINEKSFIIYQSKPKYVKELKELFKRLHITYKENIRNRETTHIMGTKLNNIYKNQYEFIFNTSHTQLELLNFINKHIENKYKIPKILFQCSKKQVEIYLREYVKGDGHYKREEDGWAMVYGKKEILDQLQHLSIVNGFSSKLNINNRDESILYIRFKESYENGRLKKEHSDIVSYDGNVWCLTTPNSNFITRREGVVAIQGNCDRTFYLGMCLDIVYEQCDDVEIQRTRHQRKYITYGQNLFGFAHGDKEINKINYLPLVMAEEEKHSWANTTYREWFLGDRHHKMEYNFLRVKDFVGTTVRFLRSVGTNDKWHYDHGWIGIPKTAEAFIYDENNGMIANFSHHIK